MKRRAVLATIGAGSIGVAGCLSSGSDTQYEECDKSYVSYRRLPAEIAAEVDEAFADGHGDVVGAYETDGEISYARAVGDGTPLRKDDRFYHHRVEQSEGKARLRFERWDAYSSPRRIELSNTTATERSVSISLTPASGDEAVNVTDVTLDPAARSTVRISSFGEYTFRAFDEGSEKRTESLTVSPGACEIEEIEVTVSAADLSVSRTEACADEQPCPWE